jgi:hypothetical protein
MTSTQTPVESTPYERFKKSYTPLYRTLLILSSIGVIVSLGSVDNTPVIFSELSHDFLYALEGIISIFIALPLLIASIVLLWKKHPVGISLRLAAYGATILSLITGFFITPERMSAAKQLAAERALTVGGSFPKEAAENIAEASYYGAIWGSIIIALVFAALWWKAWRKQLAHDKKAQSKKSK